MSHKPARHTPAARHVARTAVCAALMLAAAAAFAEDEDLNTRYAFPVSIGAEYQMLTPFITGAVGYTAYEAAASLRVPIPGIPRLQPLARFGVMQFTDTDGDALDWSHSHYYGGLGVAWANRIDRTFELTADAVVGVSEAVFPELAPDLGSIGSFGGFAEVGGRIALDPSYNFSIDIHPNIKWVQSFSVLKDLNGPIFGIGFAVNYRFGEDPDSAAAIIRSLRFTDLEFPDAFAALQSYYATHPIGSVVIENTEDTEVTDLQVSFEQKGFMEAPTPCASIASLGPGESVTVDLYASYNANVFTTEGTRPLVGEVITTYASRGNPAEQRTSVSYVLRDKTNMTWTDDEKVAAFITYEDSALRNYASWVRQAGKEHTISGLSAPFQTGILIYEALETLGCLYQTDPSKPPFEEVQGNPVVIDSVSLPRDTLRRTTGDCDDLTVLYDSLLEAVGIDTAFITVPGHIYAAFNTGVAARDYRQIHPDRAMTMPVDGELWVPVEITLIGTQGFMSAWRRGVEEWTAQENTPENRAFYLTEQAQETYWPVGLQQTDLGLQYGDSQALAQAFSREVSRLTDVIVADYRRRAENSGRKQDYNRLGIACSRLDRFETAEEAFGKALEIDPEYRSARVNLANLQFLDGNFNGALAGYSGVYDQMVASDDAQSPLAATVLLNMSRAQYEMEKFDEARTAFEQAKEIDESVVTEFAYIGAASGSEGRAAEQTRATIRFAGEEE